MRSETLSYYANNALDYVQATKDADMSKAIDRLLTIAADEGRVLDWGCGSGRDSLEFANRGFQPVLIDACPEMCALAKQRTGLPCRCEGFLYLSEESEYELIWACASLLHLHPSELKEAFQLAYRALKPDGMMYASFKYGSECGYVGGRWFTNLTEETFLDFIPKALSPADCWISEDVRPGHAEEKWLNVVLRKVT